MLWMCMSSVNRMINNKCGRNRPHFAVYPCGSKTGLR